METITKKFSSHAKLMGFIDGVQAGEHYAHRDAPEFTIQIQRCELDIETQTPGFIDQWILEYTIQRNENGIQKRKSSEDLILKWARRGKVYEIQITRESDNKKITVLSVWNIMTAEDCAEENECVFCGERLDPESAITKLSNGAWVHVVNGGGVLAKTTTNRWGRIDHDDAGDCGWWRVGSCCAHNIPRNYKKLSL